MAAQQDRCEYCQQDQNESDKADQCEYFHFT
jgi:hypothetical protein